MQATVIMIQDISDITHTTINSSHYFENMMLSAALALVLRLEDAPPELQGVL